jgi:hypothetical protein
MLARTVTGVLQHHDNIPGTSAPDAARNLDVRLRASIEASRRVLAASLKQAAPVEPPQPADGPPVGQAVKAGSSVVLWNGLGQAREEVLEFAIDLASSAATPALVVTDAQSGKVVPSAVLPPLPSAFGPGSPAGPSGDSSFAAPAVLLFKVVLGYGMVARWCCLDLA